MAKNSTQEHAAQRFSTVDVKFVHLKKIFVYMMYIPVRTILYMIDTESLRRDMIMGKVCMHVQTGRTGKHMISKVYL